jgi:dihydrofolate reductase
MGKIVNATYTTLDGDMTNMQNWHFGYMGDEGMKAAAAQLASADALIMGRATYDGFAPAWTSRAGADEFSDRMNDIKKYVVSSTLTDPTWSNTTVLQGDVASQIRSIKASTNLLQYGFGSVTRLMLSAGLLDELRIWLHPVLSGNAKPADLLYRDAAQTEFTLTDTETHSTGLIILTYKTKQA